MPATHTEPAKEIPLGQSIPADVPHAVSVSLPRWQDNVDYEEGRLGNVLQYGYPRFFIARNINRLAAHFASRFARPGEDVMLFPSHQVATAARQFIQSQHAKAQAASAASVEAEQLSIRIARVCLVPGSTTPGSTDPCSQPDTIQLYVVVFPADVFPYAKAFWQHAGDGISSRLADKCLAILAEQNKLSPSESTTSTSGAPLPTTGNPYKQRLFRNRHYSRTPSQRAKDNRSSGSGESTPTQSLSGSGVLNTGAVASALILSQAGEEVTADQTAFVEERFGRNLPLSSATLAKSAVRRRIAGTLLADRNGADPARLEDLADEAKYLQTGTSVRSGTKVTEDDVWLFPTGMSAIWHAHQLAILARSNATGPESVGISICFGFPYTDTLKILQKWGPGCEFFGFGTEDDVDRLEGLLEQNAKSNDPKILALFCEFPSNPLLRAPNLIRLRKLAEMYGFVLVVDETVGNFLNVEVLPYADLVVSSLTKVFSGDVNVMGGSLVLNTAGPHAGALRQALNQSYEDNLYEEDALYIERNSRDFVHRVERINSNTEAIIQLLLEDQAKPATERVVMEIKYPSLSESKPNYDACRRKVPFLGGKEGGYGGLFSIFFSAPQAARTFFDALACPKGPSLGTNFTLACPFAILAHYAELDWAKSYGVDPDLVRISVGLEPLPELVNMIEAALEAGRAALPSSTST